MEAAACAPRTTAERRTEMPRLLGCAAASNTSDAGGNLKSTHGVRPYRRATGLQLLKVQGPIICSGGTATGASQVRPEAASTAESSTMPVGTVTVAQTLFAHRM